MNRISIPLAVQIVIDDVGWWTGKSSINENGPWRSDIDRDHHPMDYEAIAELGKQLGMRPQASFILSEWDQTDRLKMLPDSTHMGERWSNPWKSSPLLKEAAAIIRNENRFIEVGLHGIGHEYWGNGGVLERAEWHDKVGNMRPRESVLGHLRAFAAILEENDLGPFPESFVATAHQHHYGAGEAGLAFILEQFGVKYHSLPFEGMPMTKQPESELFGFDGPLIAVNRGKDLYQWNVLDPDVSGKINGPICGMHWPNLLHPNPELNGEVVSRWVKFLEPYQWRFDTMLAANTAEGFSQLVYRWGVTLQSKPTGCLLDFSRLSGYKLPGLLNYFTIKVKKNVRILSSSAEITLFENTLQSTSDYVTVVVRRQSNAKSAFIHWTED
ncbi:hypothetical protein FHS15_003858 [Paenibacillus castaneae]|uniref:hypothetical protein n=1 Tax=Paenibacillus castaneae TaxID=474957 RepID=UPI000C9B17BF|nr:hypothetical protein [Paenibacillus castaneae]NIK78712.1 hypothetical protein [Paenibacillus castaneae]